MCSQSVAMGYTSETLGAFSLALGEVYSAGSGSGNTARPFPKSIREIDAKGVVDAADQAYLIGLLHAHLVIPFPPDESLNAATCDSKTTERFLQLRAIGLTLRECEIAFWIAEGKRDGEIAVILGVAAKTVSKHVEHLLQKLKVESRCAAAGLVIDLLNRQ